MRGGIRFGLGRCVGIAFSDFVEDFLHREKRKLVGLVKRPHAHQFEVTHLNAMSHPVIEQIHHLVVVLSAHDDHVEFDAESRAQCGVNALEDDALIEEIRRRQLGLTVCPISNAYVTDGTKASAIKTMLSKNLLVTINSDDPAYFPGYINENLLRVQEEVDLNKEEITQLVRNAFEASWLTDDRRVTYMSQVDTFSEFN